MTIAFKCPLCGARTEVAEQYAGQSGPCASCGAHVTVPALSELDSVQYGSRGGALKPAVFLVLAFGLGVVVVSGIVMSLLGPVDDGTAAAPMAATEIAPLDELPLLHFAPVDLQPYANLQLDDDFHVTTGNNLAELPQGNVTFQLARNGATDQPVTFQVGPGFIHLEGRRLPELPRRIDGIPIGRACRMLLFMHGAEWGQSGDVPDGTRIGYYAVHYADGSKTLVPIEYGRDVRDWWDTGRSVNRGHVVWEGRNEATRQNLTGQRRVRLYLCAWRNPKPGVQIEAVDFVSTNTSDAAPFCVAISAALDQPGAIDERSQQIVAAGSQWKWLHPTDGVDPASQITAFHTTFADLDFDDSQWNVGQDASGPGGGFGYGEPASTPFTGVDIGTPKQSAGQAETLRKTAYFRHRFTTQKDFHDLTIVLQRDDGVIIYLDGEEVGRDNVGDGAEAYDLHAVQTISGSGETRLNAFQLKGTLTAGEHVLAISLHNRAGGSSDLRLAEVSLHGIPVEVAESDAPFDVEVASDSNATARPPAVALIERLGGTYDVSIRGDESPVVSVTLSGAEITDNDLLLLADLTELEFLDLGETPVTDAGLQHLKSLAKLKRLVLNDTATGDDGLAALAGFGELEFLQLAGAEVTDDGMMHLAQLSNLRILTLNRTAVTDDGLAALSALERLEMLNLYDASVTDAGVQGLSEALPHATISH